MSAPYCVSCDRLVSRTAVLAHRLRRVITAYHTAQGHRGLVGQCPDALCLAVREDLLAGGDRPTDRLPGRPGRWQGAA